MRNKQKKWFRNVLVKKQACLDNRNIDLKKGNLDIFSKKIMSMISFKSPWFGEKVKFVFLSFLSKIDREKVFVDVLDRNQVLKDNKNRSLGKTQT